jgi:hypothetical protein
VPALAIGAVALVVLPALWILRRPRVLVARPGARTAAGVRDTAAPAIPDHTTR